MDRRGVGKKEDKGVTDYDVAVDGAMNAPEDQAPEAELESGDATVSGLEDGNEADSTAESLDAERAKAAQNFDRLLRMTAEFENYKKRVQRQMDDLRKFANETLIKELLSVVDNLERAITASESKKSSDASCLVEGVEMTLNEILRVLKKFHVTPVEAMGEPFDPSFHEAVMQEETDQYPENTVLHEMQKGYLLYDRLIRPAMVVVSKKASGRQPSDE